VTPAGMGKPWLSADRFGHRRSRGLGGTRRPGQLRPVLLQRGPGVVDDELDRGALLAALGLVAAVTQPPGNDHAVTLADALGQVLGELAPRGAREEPRVLAGLPAPSTAIRKRSRLLAGCRRILPFREACIEGRSCWRPRGCGVSNKSRGVEWMNGPLRYRAAALVLVGLLAACGGSDQGSDISLKIVSPTDGETVPAGEPVEIRAEIEGAEVADSAAASDAGHIHIFVDGELQEMLYATATEVKLEPGTHTITVEYTDAQPHVIR
jgi:hypothetical protein